MILKYSLLATFIGLLIAAALFLSNYLNSESDEKSDTNSPKVQIPDLRERLTPLQYHVTQEHGTEQAFTGKYWNNKENGIYRCIVCDDPLFDSKTKFQSGTGWPSFFDILDTSKVKESRDTKLWVPRTEVSCQNCGAHLGHVFPDGPNPTGLRYCVNSASLHFEPRRNDSGE